MIRGRVGWTSATKKKLAAAGSGSPVIIVECAGMKVAARSSADTAQTNMNADCIRKTETNLDNRRARACGSVISRKGEYALAGCVEDHRVGNAVG